MVYCNIEIINGDDITLFDKNYIGADEIRHFDVRCLVDSGAIMLTINEEIRQYLGLKIKDHRSSQLADGTKVLLPVAGPVEVRFEGRFCTTNALVLPGDCEVLLGAIPMEEMDLWVNPSRGIVTFLHPEGPLMMLK